MHLIRIMGVFGLSIMVPTLIIITGVIVSEKLSMFIAIPVIG